MKKFCTACLFLLFFIVVYSIESAIGDVTSSGAQTLSDVAPSDLAARAIRIAISPRLAMRTFETIRICLS